MTVCQPLTLYHTIPPINDTVDKGSNIENIAGKGESAGKQHFLLFLQCFLTFPKQTSMFESPLFCRLQMLEFGQA